MKVVNKPLEVIVWFTHTGVIKPLKFKVCTEHETAVVTVDKIVTQSLEKFAGNKMMVFRCQSVIQGTEKVYELKYEMETCTWYLFKI